MTAANIIRKALKEANRLGLWNEYLDDAQILERYAVVAIAIRIAKAEGARKAVEAVRKHWRENCEIRSSGFGSERSKSDGGMSDLLTSLEGVPISTTTRSLARVVAEALEVSARLAEAGSAVARDAQAARLRALANEAATMEDT